MSLATLMLLAARLHPSFAAHGLPPRAEPRLDAVLAVTSDPAEQAELVAVDFIETTFRWRDSRGRWLVPFGATERRARCRREGDCDGLTLADYAEAALATLRMATRECGTGLAVRMGFFRVGACRVDREARRRARIVQRLTSSP